MTTETREQLETLLAKTASELVNAKAHIRELESVTACAPSEIEKLPTPKTDAFCVSHDASRMVELARALERHRNFLTARLLEVRRDHLAYEAKQAAEIRELKAELHRLSLGKESGDILDAWWKDGGLNADPALGYLQSRIQAAIETAKRLTS